MGSLVFLDSRKQAGNETAFNSLIRMNIPFTTIRSAIKRSNVFKVAHTLGRDNTRNMSLVREYQHEIPKKSLYFKLKNPTRKFIATVSRLRIEYGQFRAHMKRIKLHNDNSYRYCRRGNTETLKHTILACGNFNLQRLFI